MSQPNVWEHIDDLERVLNDLAVEVTTIKDLLVKKGIITDDEIVEYQEKCAEELAAAKIAAQNRHFFDDLRRRLQGEG